MDNEKVVNELKELNDSIKELLKWTKFQGFHKLKEVIPSNVKTDQEKKIYELSDGKSSNEISKLVGVSDWTVRNYWNRWSKMAIVEPSKKFKGRYERVISLEDIGIEIPKMAILNKSQSTQLEEKIGGEKNE